MSTTLALRPVASAAEFDILTSERTSHYLYQHAGGGWVVARVSEDGADPVVLAHVPPSAGLLAAHAELARRAGVDTSAGPLLPALAPGLLAHQKLALHHAVKAAAVFPEAQVGDSRGYLQGVCHWLTVDAPALGLGPAPLRLAQMQELSLLLREEGPGATAPPFGTLVPFTEAEGQATAFILLELGMALQDGVPDAHHVIRQQGTDAVAPLLPAEAVLLLMAALEQGRARCLQAPLRWSVDDLLQHLFEPSRRDWWGSRFSSFYKRYLA